MYVKMNGVIALSHPVTLFTAISAGLLNCLTKSPMRIAEATVPSRMPRSVENAANEYMMPSVTSVTSMAIFDCSSGMAYF